MSDRTHYDFRTTALDPGLLSTPFRVQTKWHVITGAPSSGKSTLIEQLANQGYQTVPESARLYIQRAMAKGQEIHPFHTDPASLQRNIKDMQLRVEAGLRARELLFLDGAVPGSLAFYRVFGLDPNEILPDCFQHRYASVFILDRLPLHLNGLRFKDEAIAGFLDEWHTRDYNTLGYRVVRVPVLTPEERLAFVLDRLSEQGLI